MVFLKSLKAGAMPRIPSSAMTNCRNFRIIVNVADLILRAELESVEREKRIRG
jgi:hypothetical protein